jgi:predicted DNA repair protein MutK
MPVMTLGEGAWDDLDALLDSVAAVDEDAAACHAGLFDEDASVNQLPCAASLFM